MRVAVSTTLTDEEREKLEHWSRGQSVPHRLVMRASMVLLAAGGMMNRGIATKLGSDYQSVSPWRRRFALLRLKEIEEGGPRTGRPSNLPAGMRKRIIDTALNRRPEGETDWSTRSLAGHLVVSHMTGQRVWKEHGLQLHRTRWFKLSNDPRFEEKLIDVAGLYMHRAGEGSRLFSRRETADTGSGKDTKDTAAQDGNAGVHFKRLQTQRHR